MERLERIWWRWKRYAESLYFRKFANTVKPVTWERFFFAQWRRVVKPITYSNSAKLAGSSSTKHHSEKRFFRKSSNFLAYFWAPKYAGFVTETGWKLSTQPSESITSEMPSKRCDVSKLFKDLTKCVYSFCTYFSVVSRMTDWMYQTFSIVKGYFYEASPRMKKQARMRTPVYKETCGHTIPMNEWMNEWMNKWMDEWMNFLYFKTVTAKTLAKNIYKV